MKFGVVLPQFGNFASPSAIQRMAKAAEDLGWDSVWLCDHVVVPKAYTFQFSETFYELFTTMGYVAACTNKVKIGTSVIVLPYRHPVMTAKQVATADNLSEGRLILGVAFGWNEEEYGILDVPYEKRGKRADESLRAMKECWTSDEPRFEGDFYRFSEFMFLPKPVQRPYPPIWIGGNDHRALRRTAEFGDGWHPISGPRIRMNIEEFEARIRELKRLAEDKGREPNTLTLSLHTSLAFVGDGDMAANLSLMGSTDQIIRRIEQFTALGLSHLVLSCSYGMPSLLTAGTVDGFLETMERFTEEVMPRL